MSIATINTAVWVYGAPGSRGLPEESHTNASLLNMTESPSQISRVGQRARASVCPCGSVQKALQEGMKTVKHWMFRETTLSFSIQLINYPQQLAPLDPGAKASLAKEDHLEAVVKAL